MDEVVHLFNGVYDEFVRFGGLFVELVSKVVTGGHLSGAEWLVLGLMVWALGVLWYVCEENRGRYHHD